MPNGHVEAVLIQKQNIGAARPADPNKEAVLKAKTMELRAKAIDDYFKLYDMPMVGTGAEMADAADRYGLDWRLLPAIAVRESTGGKHACLGNEYNAFGWDSCRVRFGSYGEAIEIIAENLAGENPGTARHYDGKDTKGILLAYNPPSIVPEYASQVIYIMNMIGNKDLAVSTSPNT